MSVIESAKELLARNPEQKEIFITSDNYKFWLKSAAEAHASRLEDKSITPVTRDTPELKAQAKAQKAKDEAEAKKEAEAKQRLIDEEKARAATELTEEEKAKLATAEDTQKKINTPQVDSASVSADAAQATTSQEGGETAATEHPKGNAALSSDKAAKAEKAAAPKAEKAAAPKAPVSKTPSKNPTTKTAKK